MMILRNPVDAGSQLDMELQPGAICKLIASGQEEHEMLLEALSGLRKPSSGLVSIMGTDIYSDRARGLAALSKCSFVWPDGGLVSNLKVWENITLQAWYHNGKLPDEAVSDVGRMFERIGIRAERFEEFFNIQPVELDAFERIAVAIARAMLARPSVMVYGSAFESLEHDERDALIAEAMRLHVAEESRVSIFIAYDKEHLDLIQESVLARI